MTKTEDLLLREFERVYRDKHGIPFDYFPTQAINAGICRTREEYYSALNVLLDTGAVVKVGKREREGYYTTNLYTIPYTNLPEHRVTVQGKPNPQPSYKTTIKPFDFITLLETKTTMCNDGQVHPYSDILRVERGSRPETEIKQFFNTNPVTVTETTSFGEFVSTNREVVTQAEKGIGKTSTTAYLLMWWNFARKGTF